MPSEHYVAISTLRRKFPNLEIHRKANAWEVGFTAFGLWNKLSRRSGKLAALRAAMNNARHVPAFIVARCRAESHATLEETP